MLTVLIVEDNLAILEILVTALELSGFKTVTAVDGLQAYYLIMDGLRPDIALVDLYMPKMNGDTFLDYMRDELKMVFPIIVATATRNSFPRASRVIYKPYSLNSVVQAVTDTCKQMGMH